MSNKPDTYRSGDYAGLYGKFGSFYYGYEVEDENEEWCFEAKLNGIDRIVIPFSKIGGSDQFDVRENLLLGIGWVLTKYKLSL